MALSKSASSSKTASASLPGTNEFDILKASHRFLRDDDSEQRLSWNEQLAKKYYDNLYREFAVCDLKHYKSGNFALRWRTESEVLSGAGETTCGNTRCRLHHELRDSSEPTPKLNTLELPFGYQEHGEFKSALVKVVLCDKCVKKLMWKRNKEKASGGDLTAVEEDKFKGRNQERRKSRRNRSRSREDRFDGTGRRNSRSRSPARHSLHSDGNPSRRRRSRSPQPARNASTL
ncbi:hypothetical protein JAAARDRAFT_58576 [Jaapia argillacea MUCL 33604]|uniref:Folate-sensitive fragile site protein Fra10Ac1 n=1 Tax=Jaapia argillacea MUCL 33604 TaxID=933084 RepID=A0A067Q0S6_9AGAM|nr:hypothetical protein JAAARDRAFT_58576 [Jaapia argillacea MUCL 33604]